MENLNFSPLRGSHFALGRGLCFKGSAYGHSPPVSPPPCPCVIVQVKQASTQYMKSFFFPKFIFMAGGHRCTGASIPRGQDINLDTIEVFDMEQPGQDAVLLEHGLPEGELLLKIRLVELNKNERGSIQLCSSLN